MHRVLITGGAGFIGSHSAEALLAQDVQVTVFDNLSSGRLANLPAPALKDRRIVFIEGDVRDPAAVDAAVDGCDAVLHLAAQVSVQRSIADPVESAGHNVSGFLNVLDAVRRQRVRRLVYASSAAVYGVPATLPLDEAVAPAPLSPYGLEKFINDQYAQLYGALYGVSSLGLRFFNVYGPRQDPHSPYAGVISKFADAVRSGTALRIFGDGRQTRDFVYVGDVAQVNVRALLGQVRGVLNVGTGRSVSLLQLTQALFEAFGQSAPIRHEPAASGDIAQSATRTEAMARELGYVPATALRDGLAALAASLRSA